MAGIGHHLRRESLGRAVVSDGDPVLSARGSAWLHAGTGFGRAKAAAIRAERGIPAQALCPAPFRPGVLGLRRLGMEQNNDLLIVLDDLDE